MATQPSVTSARQRKSYRIIKEGFPQSWYAVALSSELPAGRIASLELCDGKLILYRDSKGQPHALARSCKHMGTDLSLGDIVEDDVRCPFHHWQYGADGRCTKLATSDKIPPQARLVAFPTAESWGLIWVFWGLEALYEVPSFHPALDMTKMVWKAFRIPVDEPLLCDPWLLGANGFDHQHLMALHGLREHDAHYEDVVWDKYIIKRRSGLLRYGFGANASLNESKLLGLDVPTAYLAGRAPQGKAGNVRFFVEAASTGDGGPAAVAKAEALLIQKFEHHTRLVNEDVKILNSLDPDEPGLLVSSDWGMTRYFQWADNYPTVTMRELVLAAEAAGLGQARGGA